MDGWMDVNLELRTRTLDLENTQIKLFILKTLQNEA